MRSNNMKPKGNTEKSRIVGFRAHPEFATLIQTVYECGHAYSSQLARFALPETDEIRCAKCMTGMPPDLSGREFRETCNRKLFDHPLLGSLAKALLFHMNQSEKRLYMEGDSNPEMEEAIAEARSVLEAVGIGFESVVAAPNQVATADMPPSNVQNSRGAQGVYYELPDLSLV
jgi:hypothetical protein